MGYTGERNTVFLSVVPTYNTLVPRENLEQCEYE